jgi:hypothetical protein
MPTLFALTVDTEEEWDWSSGWPVTDFSLANIQMLPRFQEICSRHGVSVTYFTNHAVVQDADARRVIHELAGQTGVEIGMHIHPWNTPPLVNGGRVTARESFLHNLPDDVIRAKLEQVYQQFLDNGLRPTSFRGGRYSSGGAIHRFLRDKDFVADASVLPYNTWADEGAPDYRGRGLLPVRLPPAQEGDKPLWEIPLTFGYSRRPFGLWRRLFAAIENSPLRHLRLIGLASKLGLVRKVWLNFEDPAGENMLPWLYRLRRMQLPCVCFTLHSSSLLPGGNGYTPTVAARDRLLAYLEEVFAVLADWDDFQPATVSEVAHTLELVSGPSSVVSRNGQRTTDN